MVKIYDILAMAPVLSHDFVEQELKNYIIDNHTFGLFNSVTGKTIEIDLNCNIHAGENPFKVRIVVVPFTVDYACFMITLIAKVNGKIKKFNFIV